MGVHRFQVACGHAGDAGCCVVAGVQRCWRHAVTVVVVLDLGERCVRCCHQELHFGRCVCAASLLGQHLGVHGRHVVGRDAGDASCCVVGWCQGSGCGAVAVVVRLDLGQGRVGQGHQGLHFGCGVCAACGLGQHLRVDGCQVFCGDAGDACCHVVGHGQCGRCGAVAVVVRLDLGECFSCGRDLGLDLGHGVGFARSECQDLGVDGRHVGGGHTGDAGCFVVGRGQGRWRGAVAVVVFLDLLNRRVGRCHQSLHFGGGVRSACGLGQHLCVDSRQVVRGDASHACSHVVGHGQCSRCGAVAVVVGLDLGQGRVGRFHQGLHCWLVVRAAWRLRQHLRVDCRQVFWSDAGDAGLLVLLCRQGRWRHAVAVVVRLDLGQRRVGLSHQGLHFRGCVGAACGLGQHLCVHRCHVGCCHAGDAGRFVVLRCQSRWCGAVAVVVRLDLGQGRVGRCHQGLHFGLGVRTANALGQHLGVHRFQVACGHAGDAGDPVVVHG